MWDLIILFVIATIIGGNGIILLRGSYRDWKMGYDGTAVAIVSSLLSSVFVVVGLYGYSLVFKSLLPETQHMIWQGIFGVVVVTFSVIQMWNNYDKVMHTDSEEGWQGVGYMLSLSALALFLLTLAYNWR